MTPARETGQSGNHSRRDMLLGIGAVVGVSAVCAPAVLAARRTAEVRRLAMTNHRTAEDINVIYWIDGEYVPEALVALNHFMRDWRKDRMREIHVRTLDILAAVHNMLDTSEPFELISGYRTETTNRMLQENSNQVASNSYHVRGMAADVRLNGRTVSQVGKAALRCRAGGVGIYRSSGFVHVDCGSVRRWGNSI